MAKGLLDAILGLRARTARAVVVLLHEGEDGLSVVHRGELATWDPEVPDSRQPHHAGLDLPAERARPVVRAAERAVRRAARASLGELVAAQRQAGYRVVACGVAGPPVRDPARIGNPHVRAHAAEGQLFRAVLEAAAKARRLPCCLVPDRDGFEAVADGLGVAAAALQRQVTGLGRELGPPWRSDHKLACLAALAALAER